MTRSRLRVLGYSQVVLAAVAILSAGAGATAGCSAKPSGSAVGGTGWVVCACAGAIIVERQADDDATADALNPMRYGEEPGLST